MTAHPVSSEELWQYEFSQVDAEISKMASLCGIKILDRDQLRRALEGDSSVCTHSNPLAFEKLHTLLKAHYLLRDRASELIGEAAAQKAIDAAVAELMRKFAAAGTGPGPR